MLGPFVPGCGRKRRRVSRSRWRFSGVSSALVLTLMWSFSFATPSFLDEEWVDMKDG